MGDRQVRRGDQVGVLDEEGDQLRIETGREPRRGLEIRRVHFARVERHQHPAPVDGLLSHHRSSSSGSSCGSSSGPSFALTLGSGRAAEGAPLVGQLDQP